MAVAASLLAAVALGGMAWFTLSGGSTGASGDCAGDYASESGTTSIDFDRQPAAAARSSAAPSVPPRDAAPPAQSHRHLPQP